ncbi:hypothetical protein RMATCC62417_18109 [Rhizopus microsporus]|nr:hypothetical protein RMATCC62417_17721 [Rhizopus microsporus]CEG84286.1 hypothetical protein RMATCC62417_18109 [Rhizopus microsporus]
METDTQSMATIDSVQPETDSTDAIEILWLTLKNLTQKLARGVALNDFSEELKALQDEIIRIKHCILSLNEAQAVCINPSSIANSSLSTPGPIFQQPASRLDHLIPAGLPVRQWRGNEWKEDADVQDSVEDLLDSFSLIVASNGLNLDKNWARLIPIKMNRDQRSWFIESLNGRNLTWLGVRKLIIKTYAAQDVAQELDHMDQLLSLKMTLAESRIRRAAKWKDDIRTATIFKRSLPAFLRQEAPPSLLHLGRDQQDSVNKVAAKAHMILSSNICQNESSTSWSAPSSAAPANNRSTSGSNVRTLSTESSRHTPKDAHRSNILGVSKASSTKNKFQCAVHGLANHSIEKCKRYKALLVNKSMGSGSSTA